MKKLKIKYKRFLVHKSVTYIEKKKKRKNKLYILPTRKEYSNSIEFTDAEMPSNFTLEYEDSLFALEFINELKDLGRQKKHINLHLEKVTRISHGAIAVLLSVINELSQKGILIKGKKPLNIEAKNILERSGFFKYMNGHVEKENLASKNIILRTGDAQTLQGALTPEIQNAMETVWGEKARCPLLFGGIGEMLRNTCDHAFAAIEDVTWHFGISHFEEDQKVCFSFIDNGDGILKTYKRKGLLDKVVGFFSNNAEVLETAFKNGIESRTGLKWRGKGLPTIYEMYTDRIISNLIVITNNVYIDFDRGIAEAIANPFMGTCYFWQINNNCTKSYFPI